MLKTSARPQSDTVPSLPYMQIGLAFFAFILIGANDGTIGVLLPALRNFYHVDKATIGLLFLAASCGYLIAAFNTGLLVQKMGQRLFLMTGVVAFLVGTLAFVFQLPFLVILFTLLCEGFGVAIIDAGLNAYIASLPRNTRLLNSLHAFYGGGAWLGPVLASSVLAAQWNWNVVYMVWSAMAFVVLVCVMSIFKQAVPTEHKEDVAAPAGNVLLEAFKRPIVLLAAFFLCVYVGVEVGLGSWSYSFLTEVQHNVALLSGWIVSGYWLGLTFGRIFIAWIAQRISDKRLIYLCLVGVLLGVLLIWLVPVLPVTAAGFWLTGFCLGPIFPTTIALISRVVPVRILPTSIGFMTCLGSAGSAFFPWLIGNIAQRIGLWSLMPVAIVLTLGMFLIWLALSLRAQA